MPKTISPLIAFVGGLIGFAVLSYLSHVIFANVESTPFVRHSAFKLALMAVAIAVAIAHPAKLSLLGMKRPIGIGWILFVIAAGALGALGTFVILATKAGGIPFARQLSFPQMVLSIWLLSSIAEEFYCRGLIQPWIDDGTSRPWNHPSVIASAALFGAMHGSLYFAGADWTTIVTIMTATTMLGYLCAVARRWTTSIWPAIIVHIGFNVGGIFGGIAALIIFGRQILPGQ